MFVRKEEKIGTFDLTNYSIQINNCDNEFPENEKPNLQGEIKTSKIAIKKAEEIFTNIYGDTVIDKKPFTISFDKDNQAWLIQGTLPKNWVGGVPHIIIQKEDGKILAIWHDK